MQKYEIEMVGRRQKRVKALRDFGNVKAGSLGCYSVRLNAIYRKMVIAGYRMIAKY